MDITLAREKKSKKGKVKIPLYLKPFWFLGGLFVGIGRFHDGLIRPLKSGLVGYLLVSKILLSIPITIAFMLSFGVITVAFLSFARANIMLYSATRVVKSINVNMLEKRKRVITKLWVITLFVLDLGVTWISFLYLVNETLI